MHKTLLNPLLRAEYGHFSHFLKTDLQNVVRKNFLEDFSDTLWVENMFRPIRVINRTDSEVIWTRICEDIDHLSKTPANPFPPQKNSQVVTELNEFRNAQGYLFAKYKYPFQLLLPIFRSSLLFFWVRLDVRCFVYAVSE